MIPEELESVRVLRLEPGDVLVASTPNDLSMEAAERIKRHLSQAFVGYEILVLSGLELSVLREASPNDDNAT